MCKTSFCLFTDCCCDLPPCDWLTCLSLVPLAGRVRVLSAVPPPADDRHPLPTPDGKLSEQGGAQGK